MSSTDKHKRKSESYAYSWFIPAPGSNGAAPSMSISLPESESPSETSVETQERESVEVRTEKWRHSGSASQNPAHPKSLSIDPLKLRVPGILGWSVMVASGAVLVSTRSGPFPGMQLGVLAGAWLGISALIWFLPKKL